MFHWFESKGDFQRFVQRLKPLSVAAEAWLLDAGSMKGWCGVCQRLTTLRVVRPGGGGWCDLRENILCECGLNGRMREIVQALNLTIEDTRAQKVLLFEQITPLFSKIREQYPFVEGCEYLGEDVPGGSPHNIQGMMVRSENMMQLSYSDQSFDLVFHGDVLEHVPDTQAALRECGRVLKPGGVMVFTCPFFDLDEHIVRAKVVEDKIEHVLPPAFHGNPMSREGSLVYVHHGWPLLTDIQMAGFSEARIGLFYDVFQGIVSNNNPYPDGHMWPVIFYAVK